VYFVDSGWTDRRRYRKQNATQSIYAMRSTPSAIISGVMVVVPMDGTITPLNATLVWSYQRIAPSGYENIWHPVRAEWSPVNPAP
jgi:hypothetical protein